MSFKRSTTDYPLVDKEDKKTDLSSDKRFKCGNMNDMNVLTDDLENNHQDMNHDMNQNTLREVIEKFTAKVSSWEEYSIFSHTLRQNTKLLYLSITSFEPSSMDVRFTVISKKRGINLLDHLIDLFPSLQLMQAEFRGDLLDLNKDAQFLDVTSISTWIECTQYLEALLTCTEIDIHALFITRLDKVDEYGSTLFTVRWVLEIPDSTLEEYGWESEHEIFDFVLDHMIMELNLSIDHRGGDIIDNFMLTHLTHLTPLTNQLNQTHQAQTIESEQMEEIDEANEVNEIDELLVSERYERYEISQNAEHSQEVQNIPNDHREESCSLTPSTTQTTQTTQQLVESF
ncbi:MAG: hypothetical protein Sylvanvirus24_10 [Sylvanvirus sp.]|uniref:Uncharacterized protein n=1 Tax=Sylvanvirus sp. TaxID=2487774 RepID=A0A3G5AIS0_9VIRU|nr:MAG: hypothetical protein Sylvanvirus24_10 [Sylvanvirus sp.]